MANNELTVDRRLLIDLKVAGVLVKAQSQPIAVDWLYRTAARVLAAAGAPTAAAIV